MGDCVITTSNKILVDNTTNLPSIQCIQYKASKCIPNEDDIVKSNINGFGNAVGSITNKVTSMYEVEARFEPGSNEYKTLQYRAKCGQLYQQAEIDKIKGIKAKPMPKYWYDWFALKPDDSDDLKTAAWKIFQRSIVADKKPYFFRYVYPSENSKWLKYQKDTKIKALMQFGKDLDVLLSQSNCTDEEKLFVVNYYSHLPLGIAPCTVNRICWKIEDSFSPEQFKIIDKFDYKLLENDEIDYDKQTYIQIETVYKRFLKERRELDKYIHNKKISDEDCLNMRLILNNEFIKQCALICPSKAELCNILIELCYGDSINSKRFVWEMCGDIIIQNLLNRYNNIIHFPEQTINGDFEFAGKSFSIKTVSLNSLMENI